MPRVERDRATVIRSYRSMPRVQAAGRIEENRVIISFESHLKKARI